MNSSISQLSNRTKGLLWLWFLSLVVVYVVTLGVVTLPIEFQIHQRVINHLSQSGFVRVDPVVRGRDVLLKGEVASEFAEDRVLDAVNAIEGVRWAQSELKKLPVRYAHLVITRRDGQVYFSGELDSETSLFSLGEFFPATFTQYREEIVIHPEVSDLAVDVLIPQLLKLSDGVSDLFAEIGANTLTYRGTVEDGGKYQRVMQTLLEFCRQHQLKLVNQLATLP